MAATGLEEAPYRKLGSLSVSSIGLGCMSMSAYYEPTRDRATSIESIRGAYEAGVNFFDTADSYGEGDNESLIGEALRPELDAHRDRVVISTKCGFVGRAEDGLHLKFSEDYIEISCENSLKRFGIEYIDLFYLHRIPSTPEELEKSLEALVSLLEKGKIHYVGLSEPTANAIQQTHDFLTERGFGDRFSAVQSEYSLVTRTPERNGVLKKCEELGIGFVPYSPLGRGLLTHKKALSSGWKPGDFRNHFPRLFGDAFQHNKEMRVLLEEISKKVPCTLPQLCLAWLLSRGEYIVPIPGSRKKEHILSNVAGGKVRLSAEILDEIEKVCESFTVEGSRYPGALYEPQNIEVSPPPSPTR